MATYLVGDIHGCERTLRALLTQVDFSPDKDILYSVGDLVARGPDSLNVLRFFYQLGDAARVVLGNHDLHLLAVAHGIKPIKGKDNTQSILDAPDREQLLGWLSQQPLLMDVAAPDGGFLLAHAGISPQWDKKTAVTCANEVEAILRSNEQRWLLENMYADSPDQWDPSLSGLDRYRYIINSFTRMRFCFPDGRLDMQCKLPPSQAADSGLLPWFEVPARQPLDQSVVFGHWAALNGTIQPKLYGLDTGCVWGGKLTLLRWEDKACFTLAAENSAT
ncbi:bis(5'-nucleosyl)-tetraphosphatase (symmetrical) [Salinivibrio kushneri]|uniref:Bis(5'-nucleosyl)-tetraphosphatase, symmetrical n=1 Tax=Salinivibrio kushneri TaxID=1908198 RepID=A0AB36JXC1_9GAMM|nr:MULTISPECIES: bis(5'-nucleosyl)-tetraphosphatase (symmetrical) ApaH [Salinivibrio]ODP98349.1 bis(5'-nucleosyl)-tetraphosphatase (symmetrical) [Salinivibrio sp. BNH]OOE39628.1 bis(5'-nucleosyl)-tetraphosphatase (symmetrical) [Salinivibrio kushneri]QCP02951.1 bis(5'-nucleosyl)-tetraphosphatase (symmetrical) [Salinivibrio kushneri]WBA11372.1 bis(5'-nucleosyl)-tetraphosphatase (symmetrical) ApaH [Salinivibrio kushneri]